MIKVATKGGWLCLRKAILIQNEKTNLAQRFEKTQAYKIWFFISKM